MSTEEINPEDVKTLEEEIKPAERRRGRKPKLEEEVVSLSKLSGEETVKILDFLHRRYLSWMTEAESTKYANIFETAREKALEDVLKTYSEIQKQNQEMISKLVEAIDSINKRLAELPQITAQQTTQQTITQVKSVLEDPRVRALLLLCFEALAPKLNINEDLKNLIRAILLPTPTEAQQQ